MADIKETETEESANNTLSAASAPSHVTTQRQSWTTPTNRPNFFRNISPACGDNAHNTTTTDNNCRHGRGDDEDYEEFLALLASSPNPEEMAAATPALTASSSTATLSGSEEQELRRVSFVCGGVDLDPPSTQAQGKHDTAYAADGCNDDECKTVAVEMCSMNSVDVLYDCPHDLGEKKKAEDEVEVPIPTTITSDANDDNDVVAARIGGGNSSQSLKSVMHRSSSYSDISRMSINLSPLMADTLAAPQTDSGLLTEAKKTESQILPSSNRTKSLRSIIRQPSRRNNQLAQSWHPTSNTAPLDTDLSVQPEQTERMEIKERPNLKKHASSILRKQRRPSRQSFRLGNALDSAQIGQIQIIDDDKVHPSRKNLHWWHAVFFFSTISLLICLLQLLLPPPYGLMMTSAEVAEVGVASGCEDDLERCICPRETICATDTISIILLTLARCSAFFDYPLYMMLFLSKAHNLNNHLRRTLFREWIDFGDMHKVHKIFGIVVGIETMSHSFFHLLRWGLNNEMSLLWQTAAGITGFVAAAVTPLICWPMVVPFLKQHIRFEVRKGLHYLSIVWAIALLFHAPSRIPVLIGTASAVYAVDHIFGYVKRNNLIETAYFERYGENGVALHFKNPKSWEDKSPTSYVLIMCPWISKYQWHAFTMFPDPSKDNHSMLCIGNSGDWTKQLYDKIKVPCMRQLYVHGPFMTEFSDTAVTTSNAIAVASGIGITPTLSLMMNYAGRKRINIIWGCRDPGLIEFILHKVDIGAITKNSFAFIFYTGKRELALPKNLPANVFIFRSRPDLENTITGIITAIHSGEGLPEELYEKQKKIANAPFRKRMMIAMTRVTKTYDENEMFDYAVQETMKAAERMQEIDLESGRFSDSGSEEYGNMESSRLPVAIPEDQVSLLGLDAMISRFVGIIGEYSISDIEDIFDAIDIDRSEYIDRAEFSAFLRIAATGENNDDDDDVEERRPSEELLLSSMVGLTDMQAALTTSMHNYSRGFSSHHSTTTTCHGTVFGGSDTKEYVQKLMDDNSSEKPLEEWSIFYCGGSNAIKKDLKKISVNYHIDLAVEKFDW